MMLLGWYMVLISRVTYPKLVADMPMIAGSEEDDFEFTVFETQAKKVD